LVPFVPSTNPAAAPLKTPYFSYFRVGNFNCRWIKDASQDFGNGENHLSMRNLVAYRTHDPFTGGSRASLVARRTEVAGFAGEGE
jgi:hypothetical protein